MKLTAEAKIVIVIIPTNCAVLRCCFRFDRTGQVGHGEDVCVLHHRPGLPGPGESCNSGEQIHPDEIKRVVEYGEMYPSYCVFFIIIFYFKYRNHQS